MPTNPHPDKIFAIFHGKCAVIKANPSGPKFPYFFLNGVTGGLHPVEEAKNFSLLAPEY